MSQKCKLKKTDSTYA